MAIDTQGITPLLSVYDMPTAVAFYKLLGFELVQRSDGYDTTLTPDHFHWCMMKRGDATIMLNTEYDTGERPPGRPAFQPQPFGSWFFLGCPDLDDAYKQLKAAGVPCHPPTVAPYGFTTLAFRDPDGHGITLQWPVETETR